MESTIVRNKRKLQILTPSGFSDFSGLSRKKVTSFYKVFFPNGEILECTGDHKVKVNGEFIEAELLPYKKEIIEKACYVYDPIDVERGNEYYTGSIINHNCLEFAGSSGTLISGAALKLMKPETPISYDFNMKQYEERIKDHIYVMSIDTSRGKGLDYSTFHILDVTTIPYKSVCVYRNNLITPTDFSEVCIRMATYYNEAQVLVEINDLGQQVADLIWDAECNIINTSSKGRNGKQVSYTSDSDRGVRTTHTVKMAGCMMLKLLIEQNKLIIQDEHTILELNTFSAKGKSWEAESGKHDDMVMSLVLFSWLVGTGFIDQLNNVEIMESLRDKTDEEYESSLMPFGIFNNGIDDEIVEQYNPWDDTFSF